MRYYPCLGLGATSDSLQHTLAYLHVCQKARAVGWKYPNDYHLTRDPEWLVDVAINRRAGWLDDPGSVFGSAMPVKRWDPGFMVAPIFQFPKYGSGDTTLPGIIHPQTIHIINMPRVIVRERQVPLRYRPKLVHRLTPDCE